MNKKPFLTAGLPVQNTALMRPKRLLVFLLVCCFAQTLLGCQRPLDRACVGCGGDGIQTGITQDEQNPPTFRITGTRNGTVSSLSFVSVSETGEETSVWELIPDELLVVANTPPITYGVIPPGFHQSGQPVALQPHQTYRLRVGGIDVETRHRTFQVK